METARAHEVSSMEPIRVLGNYQLDLTECHNKRESICQALGEIVKVSDIGRTDWLDVRAPSYKFSNDDSALNWHQDGRLCRPVVLVMWSNIFPTEFQVIETGEIIKVEPGDVVLVRNDLVMHMAPIEGRVTDSWGRVYYPNRWFVRFWVVAEHE